MKLLTTLIGFFTFSLAMPQDSLRQAHDVSASESSVEIACHNDVASARGADENLEDRQLGEMMVLGVSQLAFFGLTAGIVAIAATFYHDKRVWLELVNCN